MHSGGYAFACQKGKRIGLKLMIHLWVGTNDSPRAHAHWASVPVRYSPTGLPKINWKLVTCLDLRY
jgi:hypothetical protein